MLECAKGRHCLERQPGCHQHGNLGRVVLKLLRFAELGLKAQGVQKIYYHVKQTKDFGRLLEHLGYQDVERMYAKVVRDREVG